MEVGGESLPQVSLPPLQGQSLTFSSCRWQGVINRTHFCVWRWSGRWEQEHSDSGKGWEPPRWPYLSSGWKALKRCDRTISFLQPRSRTASWLPPQLSIITSVLERALRQRSAQGALCASASCSFSGSLALSLTCAFFPKRQMHQSLKRTSAKCLLF